MLLLDSHDTNWLACGGSSRCTVLVQAIPPGQIDTPDVREAIRKAVANGDARNVSELMRSMQSQSWLFRCLAITELGELRRLAHEAVPAIEKALLDHDAQVRHEAVLALERISAADVLPR